MNLEDILRVAMREMVAYGRAYIMYWGDFDGRLLRDQLNGIQEWTEKAKTDPNIPELTSGTEYEKYMLEYLGFKD